MGACFCKSPGETKEEKKKRYESYDRSDLQLVVTMRMWSVSQRQNNTKDITLKNRDEVLALQEKISKRLEDIEELKNMTKALLSNDPHQIHIALHTYNGTTPHEPNECYYKTLAGCKCPMSTSNVSYA